MNSTSANFHGYGNFRWILHNFTFTNMGSFGIGWAKFCP